MSAEEINTNYQEKEFYKLVGNAVLNLSGTCPLVEDEAIIWAKNKIISLEKEINDFNNSPKLG